MKKVLIILAVILGSISFADETPKKSGVSNAVTGAVSGAVSTGKDIIKGVKTGVDEGRKEGESLDDATIIFDQETLNKYVTPDVLSVESDGEVYKVTVGLKNSSKNMVRLTNLIEQKSLQLVDVDGYAVFSTGPFTDINIPGETGMKRTFNFPVDGKPGTLKIYGQDVKIDASKIK